MILTNRIKNLIKLFFRKERKFYFFVFKASGFLPCDVDLYKEAFVHKSAMTKVDGRSVYNERLEYLGDAVLDMVVADILYHKYPEADEGFMSRMRAMIVSRELLNQVSMNMGLVEWIKYSGAISITKTHLPGDALEALVAAIYLDKGLSKAVKFIRKRIASDEQIEQVLVDMVDYKSQVIQWGQKHKAEVEFHVVETGRTKESRTSFECVVKIYGIKRGEGHGVTKKKAEQMAAEKALGYLQKCE